MATCTINETLACARLVLPSSCAWPTSSGMSAPPPQQPVALIHGTQGRFLDNKQNSIEANIDYSRRVRGHHVGPMPFPLLKAAFLEDVELRRPVPRVKWAAVPNVKLEIHMYDLFVSTAIDSLGSIDISPRPSGSSHARLWPHAPKYGNTR